MLCLYRIRVLWITSSKVFAIMIKSEMSSFITLRLRQTEHHFVGDNLNSICVETMCRLYSWPRNIMNEHSEPVWSISDMILHDPMVCVDVDPFSICTIYPWNTYCLLCDIVTRLRVITYMTTCCNAVWPQVWMIMSVKVYFRRKNTQLHPGVCTLSYSMVSSTCQYACVRDHENSWKRHCSQIPTTYP